MYEKLVELLQATTQKINIKACVFEQKTEVELLTDYGRPVKYFKNPKLGVGQTNWADAIGVFSTKN